MDYTKGIGSEVTDRKPVFPVSPDNWIHKAIIAKVEFTHTEATDKKEAKPCVAITFQSPAGEYEHIQRFQEPADEEKGKWMMSKLAHIYNAFKGTGAHTKLNDGRSLGAATENTFEAFAQQVADDFNTQGIEGKPIYQDKDGKAIVMNVKFTRQAKQYSQYLDLPFPNFIEKFVAGRASLLAKHPKDNFELKSADDSKAPAGGTTPVTTEW